MNVKASLASPGLAATGANVAGIASIALTALDKQVSVASDAKCYRQCADVSRQDIMDKPHFPS